MHMYLMKDHKNVRGLHKVVYRGDIACAVETQKHEPNKTRLTFIIRLLEFSWIHIITYVKQCGTEYVVSQPLFS